MFDEKYDISLLYILNYDKKNRKILLDFINFLPFNVFQEIVGMIKRYKENNRVNLSKEIVVSGIVYYFFIDLTDGGLYISSFSKINVMDNDIFVLKLYPCYQKTDIKNFLLGNFMYQKNRDDCGIDADKVQYVINENIFGKHLLMYRQFAFFDCSCKRVNDDLMYDFSYYALRSDSKSKKNGFGRRRRILDV